MKEHTWKDKLEEGIFGEYTIDSLLESVGIKAIVPNMYLQSYGIDRLLKFSDGMVWSAEYKTDILASKTNNIFIETVSRRKQDKVILGWVYTSLSQVLVTYIPENNIIYLTPMAEVRRNLYKWEEEFEKRKVKNASFGGYFSEGILVPINVFIEDCSLRAIELD